MSPSGSDFEGVQMKEPPVAVVVRTSTSLRLPGSPCLNVIVTGYKRRTLACHGMPSNSIRIEGLTAFVPPVHFKVVGTPASTAVGSVVNEIFD